MLTCRRNVALRSRLLRPLSPVAIVFAAGLALSLSPLASAQEATEVMPDLKPKQEPVAQTTPPRPATTSPAPVKAPEPLPVKKITLYRSGVGYFERSGEVAGDAEIQLRFNTDQINDILKSMVLLDLNGGRIDSVSYGSKEPLAKRLASFGINIADNPAASEILQRLRGTPVKITMPEGEFSGTIMNVEQRPTVYQNGGNAGGAASVYTLPWINLVTKDGVKSFNLANSSGFQIMDAALAEELSKALGALAEYRADRTKTVDLRFAGNGSRRVVVGYVHEMPVWKTSYRVVLPDVDAAGQTKGQLNVQGWAVVENTTDQDWNGVQLSLVSGRPVSFQMDLYEPLFSARPWVAVPTIPGVSPRMFAGGTDASVAFDDAGVAASESARKMAFGRMETGRPGAPPAAAPATPGMYSMSSRNSAAVAGKVDAEKAYVGVTAGEMTDYAAKSAAQAATVGELFQFQVQAPVSIERQRSAMIPIVTAAVTGKRVSIYNAGDGSQYPMRGVELTNDSGLALLPGPISVFDGSAYAGDAQIGQIPKGDKRMLAYALDLEMAVITKPETRTTLNKIVISNGSLRQSFKDRLATTYEFSNKDTQRGRTLILEHPKSGDYELADTEKPTEQTQDLYRFTLPIEAGKGKKITVTQERTRWEETGIVAYDLPTLMRYRTEGKLSDKVLEAVKKAADKQGAINTTERTIAETTAKVNEISQDQDRIRKNMNSIDKTGPLYAKYISKLTEQESKLEDFRDQQLKTQKQLDEQRADLAEYLRTLSVE